MGQAIYFPILTASALRWKKTRLAAAPYTVIIIVGDEHGCWYALTDYPQQQMEQAPQEPQMTM